jgi:hypothetical protein
VLGLEGPVGKEGLVESGPCRFVISIKAVFHISQK